MKNIVFLVNDIHFNGGGERVVANMCNYFAKTGDNVTIVSMGHKKNINTFPIADEVEIVYLNVDNSKFKAKYLVYKNLVSFISKNKTAIYFGIGTYANVLLGFAQQKMKNLKTIGCEHNSFYSVSTIWKILRKLTYKKLSHCVVLTNTDLKPMSNLNQNSHVIPNSINSFGTQSSLTTHKFIAVGRLSDQKNFPELLDIFRKFHSQNDTWTLDIYGEGEQHNLLSSIIDQYNLNKCVFIHPFTLDIKNAYLSSSCLLMTSKYEGLPMALIEAQDCGLPIISYDCDTGPRDIIENGTNGFLITMGDKSNFIHAMNLISQSMELRHRLGDSAKQSSKKFYPAAIFSKWNEILNSL